MKKRFTKILGGIFAGALLLTGCATVTNVDNQNKDALIYGGSAVTVAGYTYFANAYTPYESETDFDYSGNAKVSYLARVNNDSFSADGKDFSPKQVEKVNDKVTGYQNQDMFVLGNYIYFTSMNTHQYSNLQYDYSLVTFYRSKLDGDGLQELYTTEYFNEGKFAPVGDAQNGYYWLCYTGAYTEGEDESGKVVSISLGDNAGNATTIAEKASSAVFANVKEDGSLDKVIYSTQETKNQKTEYNIYGVDYSGNNKVKYNCNNTQYNLIAKVEDDVVFTVSGDTNISYYRNVANITENENFANGQRLFVYSTSISNVKRVCEGDAHAEGFVYTAEGGSLMYKREETLLGQFYMPKTILKSTDYSNLLFVDGERAYVSNDTSIMRVSVKAETNDENRVETLATLTSIQSGKFGFDGKYVYFFGGLEDVEVEGESDEEEQSTDTNKYMYRVNKSGGEYQLIGKTVNERKPKQEN